VRKLYTLVCQPQIVGRCRKQASPSTSAPI
jgi:hypothetical protein